MTTRLSRIRNVRYPTLSGAKAKAKPRLLAFTNQEAGTWYKWTPGLVNQHVHSLLFQDGSIWDFQNGWRPRSSWYSQTGIRHLRNHWRKNVQ